MKLTLFYDSRCPLCMTEIRQLRALDRHNRLQCVDIHAPGFAERWPGIDPVDANRRLHARRADGTMLYGLDVTVEAWSLVGHHRWLKVLRLPVIRWFADLSYRLFARHRYTISYLLTGQRRTPDCDLACQAPAGRKKPGITQKD